MGIGDDRDIPVIVSKTGTEPGPKPGPKILQKYEATLGLKHDTAPQPVSDSDDEI